MLIVNVTGIGLIALIIWWFWLYKPQASSVVENKPNLVVTVENGTYFPSRIKVPSDQTVSIQFIRKDESPCAAMVLFPDFNISEELAVGKSKIIDLPVMEKGQYPFHCQMQMYRGTLIVE